MYIIKKGLIIIPKANNKEKFEIANLWDNIFSFSQKSADDVREVLHQNSREPLLSSPPRLKQFLSLLNLSLFFVELLPECLLGLPP